MNRIRALLTSLLILGTPSVTAAGPKEDVAAATQAWIAGAFPFSEGCPRRLAC